MLYVMDRKIASNGTSLVFDTDDLTIEETSCSDIHAYIKAGGKVVFPFQEGGNESCRVSTEGKWFVMYTMNHEPRTQGMYLKVGLLGKGVLYSTRVNIVWNAYPVVSFDSSVKNALVQLDWTDKHYYHEDSEEGLVKFIGVDTNGRVVLDTSADIASNCKYYRIGEAGDIRGY